MAIFGNTRTPNNYVPSSSIPAFGSVFVLSEAGRVTSISAPMNSGSGASVKFAIYSADGSMLYYGDNDGLTLPSGISQATKIGLNVALPAGSYLLIAKANNSQYGYNHTSITGIPESFEYNNTVAFADPWASAIALSHDNSATVCIYATYTTQPYVEHLLTVNANITVEPITATRDTGTITLTQGVATSLENVDYMVSVPKKYGDYTFDHWDDLLSTDPNYNAISRPITLITDMILTANYVYTPPSQYELWVKAPTGGRLSPFPGHYKINRQSIATVVATPHNTYAFAGWLLDGLPASSTSTINVTMDADHIVEPIFQSLQPETYDWRLGQNPDGSYYADHQGTITNGSDFTALFNNAMVVGETIYVEEGNYRLTPSVEDPQVALRQQSNRWVVCHPNAVFSQAPLTSLNSSISLMLTGSPIVNFTLDGGRWNGNKGAFADHRGSGTWSSNFYKYFGFGIYWATGTNNIIVKNAVVENVVHMGIEVGQATNSHIINCTVNNAGDNPITIEGQKLFISRSSVEGCTVEGGQDVGINNFEVADVDFFNNTVRNIDNYAGASHWGIACEGSRINAIGNTVSGCSIGMVITGFPGDDCVVADNYIDGTANFGQNYGMELQNTKRSIFINNTIVKTAVSIGTYGTDQTIDCQFISNTVDSKMLIGGSGSLLVGNRITTNDTDGCISLRGAINTLITANILSGINGISDYGQQSNGVWIWDNDLSGITGTQYALASSINVYFTAPQVTINVVAGTNGAVNPSGSLSMDIGAEYTFTATPNTGYYFDYWTLNGANLGSTNPLLLTASLEQEGQTLTAHFTDVAPQFVTIIVNATYGGTIKEGTGAKTFRVGDTATFTAYPDTIAFSYWDFMGVQDSTNPKIFVVTSAMNNQTLTAYFSTPPPVTYTLNILAPNNGTTNPTGTITQDEGTTVAVTAIPSIGWYHDHWELDGDNVGNANPYTVQMNADHVLQAFFSEQLAMTFAVAGDGTIDGVGLGVQHFNIGDTLTLTAIPQAGATFYGWKLDGVNYSTSNPLTLVITADLAGKTLTADFTTPIRAGFPIWTLIPVGAVGAYYLLKGKKHKSKK